MSALRGLNDLAKEFHNWMVKNDYGEYVGKTANGGHLRYRLRNGQVIAVASTPSAYTTLTNTKAHVRRMLGVKSDSPNSGKYTHKKSDGFDGRVTREDRHPPEVHRLIKQVESIDAEILSMQSRQDIFKLRKLATRRLQLTAQLQPFGIVLDPPRRAG